MSPASRRVSITNEAAIKPHENAFRRWSVPDAPDAPDAMVIQSPLFPPSTERHDTMEAHMPSSFRVYQPSELRSAPMRRGSFHNIELEPESDTVGARTLLKWTGIGILAGLCVLTALILVLNLGDDTKHGVASSSARATIGKMSEPAATEPAATEPAKPTAKVAPAAAAPVRDVDIELEAAPPPPPPPKKAVATKKKRKAAK
ncbi:MAG: hypothetical protein KIT84_34400 [Labilithrix sp.]|nr:hypothetical protein [Labilithrix sp.]MCW5816139.1 hypothetical protein [Labilithrix sp.]